MLSLYVYATIAVAPIHSITGTVKAMLNECLQPIVKVQWSPQRTYLYPIPLNI